MLDQVHAFVDCDPQFGIHRPVRLMKGRSSRLVRQEFPMFRRKLPTLWTSSYFVSTVGGAPLPVIKHSIENQKHVSLKAYKYRLYPNNRQAEKLQWTLDRAESCTMLLYKGWPGKENIMANTGPGRELDNAALEERRDA